MKKNIQIVISILLLLMVHASVYGYDLITEEILTVDEPVSDAVKLEFPDVEKLDPKIGDFIILSSLIMSSSSGERWATITIKNTTAHQRILDDEHIVAIFANGERRNSVPIKHNFSGREELTLTLSFGKHKFPIIRLLTRN